MAVLSVNWNMFANKLALSEYIRVKFFFEASDAHLNKVLAFKINVLIL